MDSFSFFFGAIDFVRSNRANRVLSRSSDRLVFTTSAFAESYHLQNK